MREFSNLDDLQSLSDDPDLKREMVAFMCACREELLEYTDEEDLLDHDYNFQLATKQDLGQIKELGRPEEEATIVLRCDGKNRKIHRLIYVAAVVFVDADKIPSGVFLPNSG